LALSAVLDDELLTAVVELARAGLAGPLARSPLALTRTVVGWCRAALAAFPEPVPLALRTAVASGWNPTSDPPLAPAALIPAPPATADLRCRIARLLRPVEVVLAS
jgi:hypothetical protein